MRFPFSFQSAFNDCGPTCLKMIATYYGRNYPLRFLENKFTLKPHGVSMLNIHKAAKAIGFYSRGVKLNIEKLKEIVKFSPVLLHCKQNHFTIVYKTPKPGKKGKYYIADPAEGLIKLNEKDFLNLWLYTPSTDSKQQQHFHKKSAYLRLGSALIISASAIKQY